MGIEDRRSTVMPADSAPLYSALRCRDGQSAVLPNEEQVLRRFRQSVATDLIGG